MLERPELKMQIIQNRSHLVKASSALLVTKDAHDNKFLECADAARADYLVMGNTRHFPKFWKKTKVITSREFIDLVAPHLFR